MNPRRSQPSERARDLRGWLVPAALLALIPKCALCLLAYAGLGTLFGIGRQELCGETKRTPAYWLIGMIGVIAVLGAGHFLRRLRHRA
jgi:hypothetical protein